MNVLETKQLTKKYDGKTVLRDISFVLTPGIYGLLGPNGAGKSTLMSILTCNLHSYSGAVFWNGSDIKTLGKRYRSVLGYVPQEAGLYPEFTIQRFMEYMAVLQEIAPAVMSDKISYSLSAVGLLSSAGQKIRTLSGGMKQRLLIAQALISEPDLLIMDEPSAGLDPKQRVAVRELISDYAAKVKIVLIATHIVSDVESIADRFLLMDEGVLLCEGDRAFLINRVAENANLNRACINMENVYLYYFRGHNDKADWV